MNVFIVEDSVSIQGYLVSMLSGIPGVSVVGCAEDELDAIEGIGELSPDVVTLDLSLKTGSGIAVLDYIKMHHAAIKVIVLTNYVDDFYIKNCRRSGADFVFDKTLQFPLVRSVLWSWVHDGYSGSTAKS